MLEKAARMSQTNINSSRSAVLWVRGTAAQRKRNQSALRLLRRLAAEDPDEQTQSWAVLKRALEENRSGYRKVFSD
jgi:hypothetical protein